LPKLFYNCFKSFYRRITIILRIKEIILIHETELGFWAFRPKAGRVNSSSCLVVTDEISMMELVMDKNF
jgi:hypothetical protein